MARVTRATGRATLALGRARPGRIADRRCRAARRRSTNRCAPAARSPAARQPAAPERTGVAGPAITAGIAVAGCTNPAGRPPPASIGLADQCPPVRDRTAPRLRTRCGAAGGVAAGAWDSISIGIAGRGGGFAASADAS
jgi:hypothetical protein